jgi:nucleotide-binding universal stress UspA family protein
VLAVADGLSRLLGATLHIVHVTPHALPARQICDKLQLAPLPLSGTVLDQYTGPPAAVIVEQAKKRESRFIVMSGHTGAARPEGGFGEIARDILLHTPCPVLLVPSGWGQRPWSLRQLLVPHDGTPASAQAIGAASKLCHDAGADMTILHVATTAAAPPEDTGSLHAPHYADQPQHEWPAWGVEFLSRARAIGRPHCDVHLRTVLCTEPVGEAIVRFASDHESDLMALAWRRQLECTRALTIRMVVQRATCPIAIYPIRTDRENPPTG